MDLHALTSKSEIEQPETPEELTLPEPTSEPEQTATEGKETMSTESPPPDSQNTHDAVFREVHVIVAYYIILIAFTALLLLNVWGGDLMILKQLGLTDKAIADPFLRTVGYTIVGSVLGSILYNMRVLFYFYLTKGTYDRRWFGKYLSAPWESAAMSLVVLALVRGGAALFGGTGTAVAPPTPTDNFGAFSMGALVGFGMRDVVRWVQGLVETTFGTLAKDKTTNKE